MNAANAGSRDPVATFGMTRQEARKSILLRFLEALKESRCREAQRIIATYAHLLADRDTPETLPASTHDLSGNEAEKPSHRQNQY